MDRRIIAATLTLLLCASVAWGRMGLMVVGGGGDVSSGTNYTDCSSSTAALYWYGDHADGTQYGCTGSTRKTGAWTSASAVASGTDPGTESPGSGDYAAKNDSTSDRLTFTVSSGDIIDTSEGYFEADVYIGNASASNYLLSSQSGSDNLEISVNSTNNVVFMHKGGGGTVTVLMTSSATIPENTWTKVIAKWSVSGNYLKITVGSNSEQTDADAVTAYNVAPSTLFSLKGADTFYIDNIKIFKTPTP